LWHGTRLTNYVGILTRGMQISPPEAQKSGGLFGKGIYFADFVSKAFSYCRAYQGDGTGSGLVILGQVALGKSLKKQYSDYNLDEFITN
jgi:poly [ADP-ribose] polymerase